MDKTGRLTRLFNMAIVFATETFCRGINQNSCVQQHTIEAKFNVHKREMEIN